MLHSHTTTDNINKMHRLVALQSDNSFMQKSCLQTSDRQTIRVLAATKKPITTYNKKLRRDGARRSVTSLKILPSLNAAHGRYR